MFQSFISCLRVASFDLPVRRHPSFDLRFFGPDRVNLRHIAGKTGTHLQMPLDMDEPVR